MVRNCSCRRHLAHRAQIGLSLRHDRQLLANLAVGPGEGAALPSWSSSSNFCLVLLSEETLELGPELITAWQIFVPRQQRPILLSGNERIVLSLQCRHHLSDLGSSPRPAR